MKVRVLAEASIFSLLAIMFDCLSDSSLISVDCEKKG